MKLNFSRTLLHDLAATLDVQALAGSIGEALAVEVVEGCGGGGRGSLKGIGIGGSIGIVGEV